MRTKRSRLLTGVSVLASAALLLTACGGDGGGGGGSGVVDENADKGLPVVGENVTYDPNTLVNEGQPVALEWWAWDFVEKWQEIADAYEEIHPNVTITGGEPAVGRLLDEASSGTAGQRRSHNVQCA